MSAINKKLSVGIQSPGWPQEYFPNGITKYVEYIKREMEICGVSVTVLAAKVEKRENYSNDIIDVGGYNPGISIFGKILRRLAPLYFDDRQGKIIFRALAKSEKFRTLDIIEVAEAFGRSRLLKKIINIPIVVHLHGPWVITGAVSGVPLDGPYRVRVRKEGEAIASADGVTAPSFDVLRRVREYYNLPLENAEVIPNPIPTVSITEKWSSSTCKKSTLLFVGRFDRLKGGDIVIEAFSQLVQIYDDLNLIFIGPDRGLGDGTTKLVNLDQYISSKFSAKHKQESIKWMGQIPHHEVERYRKEAFVTIVASRYENFGNVLLEAMSFGCPLVASDVGGNPEIVDDGYSGLLFKSGDAEDLSKKLQNLIDEPELASKLGDNAFKECCRRFNARDIAIRRIDYYKKILSLQNKGTI